MISSIQNRQQNTAFKATIFPHEVIKELQESGKAPTTLSDIAKDIFDSTQCQGAGLVHADPQKFALAQGKIGHNVVPSNEELESLQKIKAKLVSYDLVSKGFRELQKLLEEAKPATPKEIAALRAKAKQKPRLLQRLKQKLQ